MDVLGIEKLPTDCCTPVRSRIAASINPARVMPTITKPSKIHKRSFRRGWTAVSILVNDLAISPRAVIGAFEGNRKAAVPEAQVALFVGTLVLCL
jgi:hypothetical protein